MRLGELLIEAGVLTAEQLEETLLAQVMLGVRLGTCLVEAGHIDLDGLANALAHQRQLPAALAKHFNAVDRELPRRLSPAFAERYACVPLFRVGARAAVIAATDPLEARPLAIIGDELDVAPDRLIVAVAPELRVRYALEQFYGIARPRQFLRAPGAPIARRAGIPLAHSGGPRLDEPPPVEPVARETSERRSYVPTLLEVREDSEPIELDPSRELEEVDDGELASACELITSGTDREEIVALALAAIQRLDPASDAAVLFALRGAVAVSAASSRRDRRDLPAMAVPLDRPSVVAGAARARSIQRSAGTLEELDARVLAAVGLERGSLVAAPIVAGKQLVAVIVVAGARPPDAAIVETIAGAAAAGIARLVREAIADR